MDPNVCLEELRKLAKLILDPPGYVSNDTQATRGERLAELAQALDGWLSKGGFLPKDWERKP